VAIAGAFARWKETIREAKALGNAILTANRIMLRIRHRSISAAFDAWYDRTHSRKQLRYSLRKLVARWQRLQLAGPFNDWVLRMDEVHTDRQTLHKAAHRMSRAAIARAFASW
jgi:hypothetical protein